jgi:hypothetical protein
MTRSRLIPVLIAILGILPDPLRAADRPIEATVPADALAVFFSRPSPDMANPAEPGAVESLGHWLVTLKAMGLLPQQGRIVADIIGTVPLLARRPYALVLMDITAMKRGPGSYRLNDMKSALVVDSEGIAVELDRRIRDVLSTYTDDQNGHIDAIETDRLRYHRLSDQRLPAWAVSEWGSVDGYFVVGFGQGAFETMLAAIRGRSPALAADPWYAQAHRRCSAISSGLEAYVAIARTEKRLADILNDTVRLALQAVQLDRAARLLMTVGFDGRALHSELLVRDADGRDHHMLLTGKEVAAPEVLAQIPDAAKCFVAFRFPLGDAIRQAREGYYKTQSDDRRRRFSEGWARLENEFHFDVETGLLDHLGDHLIFHTFPPHPLRLPLIGTIWIQTDGDRAAVAQTVDAMMSAWQHYANRPPAASEPARFRLTPEIHQDPDGVWYLQLGLLGPALAVTDNWIVISFSPEAVRQNLAYLKDHPATTRPSP